MNVDMRDLFEKIWDYTDDDLFNQLLIPWIENNKFYQFIKHIADLTADVEQIENIPIEVSWDLYALSRVLDILTLRFQSPQNQSDDDYLPKITREEYIAFVEAMGLTIKQAQTYHPFYSELIRAEPSLKSLNVLEERYPTLMLGHLVIKRGGVVITMHPSECNIDLVNHSQIYWAYRRTNRPYQDQSHGWGSNSQWRTSFRFDCEYQNGFLYNAQGNIDISTINAHAQKELELDGLSFEEARELTKYRHFITCTKEDSDLYPYQYKLFESLN